MVLSARMKSIDPVPLNDMFSYGVDPTVLSLACGNPDPLLFPAEAIARIARQVIIENPGAALQYGETRGYRPFLEALCHRLAEKQQIACKTEQLCVVSGSQQGLELMAKTFVNEGDVVLVEEPAFIGSLNAFRSAGAKLIGIPLQPDGMDLDALDRLLTRYPETKFVYTIPTSNNPTGITMCVEKRRAFYAIIKKHRVLVAEDDPYCELRFDGRLLPPMKSMDTEGLVVYFGSFSKILAPGLRLGYVCAAKEIIDALLIAKQTADLQTAGLPQMIAAGYLSQYDLDDHICRLRTAYRDKCAVMLSAIDRYFPASVSRTEPDGGLFLWCDLNDHTDTNALIQQAIRQKVAFVPGYAFAVDQTKPQSSFRLNYSAYSAEKIEEGVRRMGRLLSAL